jgi:CubicO group peptidase (beta-lactamase class C family)
LPTHFTFDGQEKSIQGFLEETDSSALLVLKNDEVRCEEYLLTGGRDVRWISWSVAKSFVSAMVGIAIDEGKIGSINEPITQYVPALSE